MILVFIIRITQYQRKHYHMKRLPHWFYCNKSWWCLSLLVVRRFDDDAAQRVSLCRRMWLLSLKVEAQTWPHTVQADPCRVVVGGGWLRCWCLRARFATATSICCCSNVASPLSQTARHSSRSRPILHVCRNGSRIYLRTTECDPKNASFDPPLNVGRRRVHYKVGGGDVCFQASLSHGQVTSVVFWEVSSRGMLCLLCSSLGNLNLRYFVPPVHVQDSLKTPNVKGLEGSDVTTVRCPSLTCIQQCRDADCVVNGHLGVCGKVTVRKNSLGQTPEGSGR